MSIFTKIAGALSLKALTGKVRFPGRALVFFDLNRPETTEIAREVGDGTSSDVLMTPIRWLQRAIVEAPVVAKDDKGEPLDPSDLVALLEKPNPFYAGDVLLAGTVLSLSLDGNAYWIAATNAEGRPVELFYAPHTNVEPRWPSDDNKKFITYYEYSVAGDNPQKIRPAGADDADVAADTADGLVMIHFREGVDLDNLRKGLSPLKGLLREVWTDNEAASFTASLLRNNGIPGLIVSPVDKDMPLTPEEAKIAKDKITTEFTREGRGRVLVNLGPTKVEQFGFSPKELDLSPLRDVSEERVTAALGVPAAVVGFGAGLQQTRVGATMRELRMLAWTNGVIPIQRTIAGEVTRALAPVFDVASVEFDNLGVEALRENQDTKAKRIEGLVRAGIWTRAEARVALGQEAQPGDDVYLLSLATLEVPQGEVRLAPGGNGGGTAESRAWAADYLSKRHTHDPTEEAIIDAAPSRKPTAVAARLARRLDGVRRAARVVLQEPLQEVFRDLGRAAFAAARDIIGEEQLAGDGGGEQKQDELTPREIALLEEIADAIDIQAAQRALGEAFEQGFLVVSQQVSGAVAQTLGVEFVLDDAAQRTVMRAGGLQAGLIDLDQQTRDALFDALVEARAEGLTGDNLARRIRDRIEAGPWRDVETRARVIARTEGGHAANVSTLEAARSMPETEHVQVFDDRIGFGDEACVAANGSIITIQEAEAIGLAHPNCTRAFVPINSLLMEEMGL